MTTAPIPLCESCSRLGPGPDGIGFACAAFPEGISDEIYVEGADHRRPFPGDRGIVYSLGQAVGDDARLAAYERGVARESSSSPIGLRFAAGALLVWRAEPLV